MRARVEPCDLSLAALDALEADSMAAFVGAERPLQGLAGLVDWRLCGAVSRAILAQTFSPESGEALLLPSGGRFPVPRIFFFGLAGESDAAAEAAARHACEVLAKAGARRVAVALPPTHLGAPLARAWMEASLKAGFSSQVLLGDARALARELDGVVRELSANADVVAPVANVEPGQTAASLPPRGPVVR